jgi:histidinol-phosphate aminotransferase
VSATELPLRHDVADRTEYGPPRANAPVRLDSNENPWPPPPELIEGIAEQIQSAASRLHRYPDRTAAALRSELAEYLTRQTGFAAEQHNLWVANGSNDVLHQLLRAFGGPGRTLLGFAPSYRISPAVAANTDTMYIQCRPGPDFTLDLDAALRAINQHHPHVIFLDSPNNPTGLTVEHPNLRRILDAAPGLVLLDEAYAEFSPAPSAVSLLNHYPTKLVITRTMSKAFGIAGVRVGYLIATPAVVDAMTLVCLPYHLSTLTQATAIAALHHTSHNRPNLAMLIAERERVSNALHTQGYNVIPSHTNFILFGRFTNSTTAWQQLLNLGVLVRDVGVPQHLRTTIGLPHHNNALLHATQTLTTDQLAKKTR